MYSIECIKLYALKCSFLPPCWARANRAQVCLAAKVIPQARRTDVMGPQCFIASASPREGHKCTCSNDLAERFAWRLAMVSRFFFRWCIERISCRKFDRPPWWHPISPGCAIARQPLFLGISSRITWGGDKPN